MLSRSHIRSQSLPMLSNIYAAAVTIMRLIYSTNYHQCVAKSRKESINILSFAVQFLIRRWQYHYVEDDSIADINNRRIFEMFITIKCMQAIDWMEYIVYISTLVFYFDASRYFQCFSWIRSYPSGRGILENVLNIKYIL